jgi:hypothetical protein
MLRKKKVPQLGLAARGEWPKDTWLPRVSKPGEYGLDLDAGERYTRFINMRAPVVTPDLPGLLSGFLPLFDIRSMVYAATAKAGFGPGTTQYPVNLQWQVNIEGLDKRSFPQ